MKDISLNRHFSTAFRTAALFLGVVTSPALAQFGEAPAAEIERADFFREGVAPVRKSGAYDVTVVYFFDYQCPACRQFTPGVDKALGEDKRVRIIYRDVPIFGPRSEQAAKLALASRYQGRHDAFHHALMTQKLPLDDTAIRAAADKAGLDWDRLQKDAAAHAAEISAQIARNLALHEAAGIAGTPAFIVNDSLADGALDYKGLKGEIADARAKLVKPVAQAADTSTAAEPANTAEATANEAMGNDLVGNDVAVAVTKTEAPMFKPSAAAGMPESAAPADPSRPQWQWFAGIAAALLAAAAFVLVRRRHRGG